MVTIREYVDLLHAAGWADVDAEDWTDDLVASQRYGLAILDAERGSIVERYGEAVHRSLVDRWTAKLVNSTSGQLSWMALTARKPG